MPTAPMTKTYTFEDMTESESAAEWMEKLQPGCSIEVKRNKKGEWIVETFDGEYTNVGKGKTLQEAFEEESE